MATLTTNEVVAWRSGRCVKNGCGKRNRTPCKAVVTFKVDINTKGVIDEVTRSIKHRVESGVVC